MNILDKLNDNTLLITPYNIKKRILKENKQIKQINALTKEELRKKVLFDYNKETIMYLVNKYKLKVEVALMYLNNMYYIDNTKYDSDKLNTLASMKQELVNNNLLSKDILFINNLSNYKVIVYGYDYIDKSFNKYLDIVSKYTKVEIVNKDILTNNNISIYQFNEIEEEVNYIAYTISNMLKNGTDINNIKLSNVIDEYNVILSRIFNLYNIPLNLEATTSIYGTSICLSFIDLFKSHKDLKTALEELNKLYNLNDENNLDIYNKIVNICNEYIHFDDNVLEMIIYDLKNTYLTNNIKSNAINIIDLKDNIFDNDDIIFILGFNQGLMPLIYKNEDFITDDLSNILNIESTMDKNIIEYNKCLNIIKRLSKVIITYKLKTKDSEYYPSSLIDDLNINVIINPIIDLSLSFSPLYNQLMLSRKIDKLIKYNEIDNEIGDLYNNYNDILYKTYDNTFKGINNNELIKYLNNKLVLSYSSIDNYYKCGFKYYLNNILKLIKKEDSFYLVIGNIYHYVLSKAFNDDFDLDKEWSEFLKDKELDNKSLFLLEKLKEELVFIINEIKEHYKLSSHNKALYEEKIVHYFNDYKVNVIFMGFIDKILIKDDIENTLISLVDYKTGNTNIDLKKIGYGLNLQLPVYIYLVKNSSRFKNAKIVGFYLQEILHNEITKKDNYLDEKKKLLKLKGYSINDISLLKEFDLSYTDSRVISSIRVTNDNNFYKTSKVLSEAEINDIIKLVDNKIKEAIENILKGEFTINPKIINNKNESCKYCEFKDICYVKEDNYVYLNGTDEEEGEVIE